MEINSKIMELAGRQAPRTPSKKIKRFQGATPPGPPNLNWGASPPDPRGFPRVLGLRDNCGLIHGISSLYVIKIWCQNIMSTYDVKLWYQNMISKYDIEIWYQNMISKHDIKTWYQNTISKHVIKVDITRWCQNMISKYDIKIQYWTSIKLLFKILQ